jgi:hypothetical protein
VKKISAVAANGNEIFKEPKLTIGLDLGDRSSHYCILDEAGNVILEHNLPATPKGIHQVFSRIPRSRIALETAIQHEIDSEPQRIIFDMPRPDREGPRPIRENPTYEDLRT